MFNNWIRAGRQVELDSSRVVDPDLVGLQMNEAVGGLIDEAGPTDAANIQARLRNVLHVEALDAEWENDGAVAHILHDDVLFALVLGSGAHDTSLVLDVLDQQVVALVQDLLQSGRTIVSIGCLCLRCA